MLYLSLYLAFLVGFLCWWCRPRDPKEPLFI